MRPLNRSKGGVAGRGALRPTCAWWRRLEHSPTLLTWTMHWDSAMLLLFPSFDETRRLFGVRTFSCARMSLAESDEAASLDCRLLPFRDGKARSNPSSQELGLDRTKQPSRQRLPPQAAAVAKLRWLARVVLIDGTAHCPRASFWSGIGLGSSPSPFQRVERDSLDGQMFPDPVAQHWVVDRQGREERFSDPSSAAGHHPHDQSTALGLAWSGLLDLPPPAADDGG